MAAAAAALAITPMACTRTGPGDATTSGPVSFYREHVTVRPSEGRTRVAGHYYFRNTTSESVEVAIGYPFPVDAHHAPPSIVEVWRISVDETDPVGFHRGDSHARWRMNLAPMQEQHFFVRYVQRTSLRHAVYIVTTTQEWGEPIELAEFEFRIPAALGDVRLSFEPDSMAVQADTLVYYASWKDFMPDSDLEVWWE